MNLNQLALAAALISAPLIATAAPSVNDMQGCRALIQFLDEKLQSSADQYPAADINAIRHGLEGYDHYIQADIIAPGLLKFNRGDKVKAAEYQLQVDAHQQKVVALLHKRYPQNQLFTDHAIQVNNCAKQAVPAGQALEDLKLALNTMVKLAPPF